MNLIIVCLAFVAVAAAKPDEEYVVSKLGPENAFQKALQAQIDGSLFKERPEGSYNYEFETDDGLTRVEDDVKKALDEENKPHKVVYINKDGKPEVRNYSADSEGESIPKPLLPVSRR